MKIYNIFSVISSLYFYIIIYYANFLIGNKCELIYFASINRTFDKYHVMWVVALASFVSIVFVNYIWIKLIKEGYESINTITISTAEQNYIPVYICYFVIALSINDYSMFVLVSVILFLLLFFSKNFSFNNILLFIGYRFYFVQSNQQTQFLVISKRKDLKNIKYFDDLRRVNNFTYLDTKR